MVDGCWTIDVGLAVEEVCSLSYYTYGRDIDGVSSIACISMSTMHCVMNMSGNSMSVVDVLECGAEWCVLLF